MCTSSGKSLLEDHGSRVDTGTFVWIHHECDLVVRTLEGGSGDLALGVSSAINLLCHSSPLLWAPVSSRIKCDIELYDC